MLWGLLMATASDLTLAALVERAARIVLDAKKLGRVIFIEDALAAAHKMAEPVALPSAPTPGSFEQGRAQAERYKRVTETLVRG